ncbi:MAG: hypothetical protein IJL93_06025 [Bacteroidales bacterium]|nr:hypothetical protein [Bacteroidales bacterium]
MKTKSVYFFSLLASLLLFSSCSDMKQRNDLYGDWWPVHASGSADNEKFTAKWDGDLGIHGDIVIKFVNKNNADLSYEETRYYSALSFSKKRKAFCTISLKSLGEMKSSSYRKFEVKDGKLYFEKTNSNGKGTGEFGDGQDLSFINEDVIRVGNVKYERFAYFKNKHPEVFKPFAEMGFDLETIPVLFVED